MRGRIGGSGGCVAGGARIAIQCLRLGNSHAPRPRWLMSSYLDATSRLTPLKKRALWCSKSLDTLALLLLLLHDMPTPQD